MMECTVTLRPYQEDAIRRLRQTVASGKRSCILVSPTGSGKTVAAAALIRSAIEKQKHVLFLAHARELVNQCSQKLWDFGVEHGIIMRGEEMEDMARVQVASKATLVSWLKRMKLAKPPADLIVVDEAHRSLSKWWRYLIELYPDAVVIGLTATPARGDGRGLGELYGGMVEAVPSSQLIREGFLVPTRVFAPYRPNLKGIPRSGTDFAKKPLERRMDKPQLVGDIVGHWKKHAEDRQTVVFATGVQHSLHIRDEFVRAGIRCEHLDGTTDMEERDAILGRLRDGDTRVLTNVGVCTEGWDCPVVSCCVMACPTKSYVKYRQCCGRIQRPYPGKTDALLLDHAGCVYMHGFPDDDVEWTLDSSKTIEEEVKERRKDGRMKEPICCPACHAMFSGKPACPNCGFKIQRRAKDKDVQQGMLIEVDRDQEVVKESEDRQRYWHRCLGVMANNGRSAKAAGAMFRARYGVWPEGMKNIPDGKQWNLPVADLYPQYRRTKRASGE